MVMKFHVSFMEQGRADGVYTLQAQGCAAAMLSWADERGALAEWTSFAYLPLDACGKGKFIFRGGCAIPPEATHIYVRAVSDDFMETKEELFEIPLHQRSRTVREEIHICVMSDLYLSSKTVVLRRAFALADGADVLLLVGDMTNDGTAKQHELLKQCMEEALPDMRVFSVTGNHDIPRIPPEQEDRQEIRNHLMFQKWLFERMEKSSRPHRIPVNNWKYGPDRTEPGR